MVEEGIMIMVEMKVEGRDMHEAATPITEATIVLSTIKEKGNIPNLFGVRSCKSSLKSEVTYFLIFNVESDFLLSSSSLPDSLKG